MASSPHLRFALLFLPHVANAGSDSSTPGMPRGRRERAGRGRFLLDWLCCELETALSGPNRCLSEGVSFHESLYCVSGLHARCHIHRFLKANAPPSQLIAYSLLSPWEPGNREGKPSLLRSVHSFRWPSRAGPRWPCVSVCAYAHAHSLACGPHQIHTRPSAWFPRWLRVSQQSCQHLPTCPRPYFRSMAQQFGSHLQGFCSMRASGTDTLDPPPPRHGRGILQTPK